MKKVLTLLLVFCSIFLISCNKETDRIFNIALPNTSKIEKIGSYLTFSNLAVFNATKTELYIQDSDNKNYSLGMAKSMPIDVTSEYVGKEWGIEEGETGKAWKIELRDDLCWENGEKITAQNFIDSMVLRMTCPFEVIKGNSYKRTEIEGGYIDISDVGIRVIDNALILIYSYAQPVEVLCESLSENTFSLVHKKMYDECFERDLAGNIVVDKYGVVQNDYGSSPDKYLSYGPYKLVKLDEEGVRLVRNENWFGYKDLSEEYYQTEEIVIEYLDDYSASYDLFTKGKYDYINFTDYAEACDEKSYKVIDEKYIYFDPLFTTSQLLMFNTNLDMCSIPEFRKALLYSLDMSYLNDFLEGDRDFITNDSAYHYLHPFYTATDEINEYAGEYFCETEEFKEVYEEYYDDLFTSAENKDVAKELFNEAYNIALDKGYINEEGSISINLGLNSYAEFKLAKNIIKQWEDIILETKFAGKIKFDFGMFIFEQHEDPAVVLYYYNHNYVYYLEGLAIESALNYKERMGYTDFKNEELSITFERIVDVNGKEYNGVTLSASIINWIKGFEEGTLKVNVASDSSQGEEIIISYEDNALVTNKIMAECEKFVLSDYHIIPFIDRFDPKVISDNVSLNYNYELHYNSLDFRFITYK